MVFSKSKLSASKNNTKEKNKPKLLIVDDEELNIRFLEQLLCESYNVLKAYDGKEAIEILSKRENQDIFLIISDQRMPNMTGTELLKLAKDILPNTIRIILTGYSDIECIISSVNEGNIYKFMQKPIEPQELKITSKLALETFSLEKENELLIEKLGDLNNKLEEKVEHRTKELNELNYFQENLLATIVHDLKNPLSNIIMFSKYISTKELDVNKSKEISKLIHESGYQMSKMVENLLDISRIEQGFLKPYIEKINLLELLKKLLANYNEKAESKKIKLVFNSKIEKAFLKSDLNFLKRIFDNLLSNSIKFSPFDKKITLNIKQDKQNYIISFTDEGPGITESDKKKLFLKFNKLSAQPTDGESSTGLGLSIVNNLVKLVNGKVWCESEYGKGANFFVSLPKNF